MRTLMPRKSESNTTAVAQRSTGSLRELRGRIDKLDLQILDLVSKRASLAGEIGRIKNDHGEEIFNPAREEEVLQNVLHVNDKHKGPLSGETIRAVFREIMSASRS